MKFSSRFGFIATLGLVASVVKAGQLQACSAIATQQNEETCGSGSYCIDENDNLLYAVGWGNGVCAKGSVPQIANQNLSNANKVYFFFEADNSLITTTGSVDDAFECASANNAITSCSSFDAAQVVKDKYYINAATNTLSGGVVNYSSAGYAVIDGKSGSYYPTDTGLIKCNTENCGFEAVAGGNSYYLSTLVGYIIKCTSNTGCDNVPIVSETYFLNAAFTPSSTGSSSHQLIYCNGSQCEGLTTTSGHYVNGDTGGVITCESTNNGGQCSSEEVNINNFYISSNPNILIKCTTKPCENVQAKIGIYLAGNSGKQFIQCDSTTCNKLQNNEVEKIPECEITGNKCVVVNRPGGTTEANSLIPEGGYCTNEDKNVLYFATNTIELKDSIVVTSSSNCIPASSSSYQKYYTVGSTIYHIDDGEVSQITAPGYYFINTSSNKLVTGSKIEDYNNSYVKLYKCNGVSCVVVPNPSSTTYYVDVSKRIFKYTGNTFSFAYDKDVLCAYSNNKCVPNTDLKSTEFCVTSAGELVIAAGDIEAKKSGNCYKSSTINNEIFGYSSNLYKLNLYDATLVDNTGYYLVSISSNSTTEYKEFSSKNNDIILYGCSLSSCTIRTPEEGVYYYDNISHYLVRYDAASSQWIYPTSDGYALISTEPGEQYVRKFTVDSTATNKVTITEKVSDGYYYTTDNEMYECPNTEGSSCDLINESMYVMTNDNELYYCNVDDDNLASTVCNKQSCVLGELYYIGGYHFRCVTGNIFNILSTKYCNTDELVVVNFPTAFSETYPSNVKNAVDEISKNNNNTATVKAGSNHLTVIPGIFTNCTYDKEEKMASFDLVCIENYVVLDNEKEPQICSTAKLGFVGCNEDSENPDKCNPSSAATIFLSKIAIAFAMLFLGFMLY